MSFTQDDIRYVMEDLTRTYIARVQYFNRSDVYPISTFRRTSTLYAQPLAVALVLAYDKVKGVLDGLVESLF
jgi:hypothetical protein